MWLVTNIGFFSVVQKTGTDFLTVRARVRGDLDNLREQYLPELSEIIGHAGTDYPWRATVTHAAFAAAMGRLVTNIRYPNFKDEVRARQGAARAHKYHEVWDALWDLPERDAPESQAPRRGAIPNGKMPAYGGVVFDTEGRVLLREPRGHFDGYRWTFPKGRPERGESPEAAALRETFEETGVRARIVAPVPGEYPGGTTSNRYFLMEADAGSGGVAADDPETTSIRWVSPEEARRLIAKTTNPVGKKRDLEVLDAALEARKALPWPPSPLLHAAFP